MPTHHSHHQFMTQITVSPNSILLPIDAYDLDESLPTCSTMGCFQFLDPSESMILRNDYKLAMKNVMSEEEFQKTRREWKESFKSVYEPHRKSQRKRCLIFWTLALPVAILFLGLGMWTVMNPYNGYNGQFQVCELQNDTGQCIEWTTVECYGSSDCPPVDETEMKNWYTKVVVFFVIGGLVVLVWPPLPAFWVVFCCVCRGRQVTRDVMKQLRMEIDKLNSLYSNRNCRFNLLNPLGFGAVGGGRRYLFLEIELGPPSVPMPAQLETHQNETMPLLHP